MNQQATTNRQYVELMEWLITECGITFDPITAKRAVQETQRAWPGSEQDRWWKWLIEAGSSLGLHVRVVEFTIEQALQLAQEKILAVRLSNSSQPWLLIHKQHRHQFHIITAETGSNGRWVSRSELLALMGNPPQDEQLIWVVAESAESCSMSDDARHTESHSPLKPMKRLWMLLAAERADMRIVLVFALFVGALALAMPLAVELLTDIVAFGRSLHPIIILAVILFAFLTFSAIVQAVEWYVVELIQRRLFVRIAGDLAYRLPRIQRSSHDTKYAPELVNHFLDVVTVQKAVSTLLLDALALATVTMTGMVVLALFHPLLLGIDIVLVSMILLVLFVMGRGGTLTSIKESKVKYMMVAWLEGLARCNNTLKYAGGNKYAIEHTDHIARKYLSARQTHFRILFRQIIFNLGLFAIGSAVFLAVGGYLVIQGQLSLGQLIAAELIVAIILGSVAKMGKHLESYYDLMASVDKLGVLFDLPLERQDGLLSLPGNGGIELNLRNVCYGYRDGQAVLKKVSLKVKSGSSVGICGPSGCGKSTLAELLFGLRRATSGIIELDGVDGSDLRPDILRQHVSLVGPVEVISGTITENVHLDRDEINSSDVHVSLRQVDLLDSVYLLPDGLETRLTATGSPLSETQVRRLVLARAIAGRPRLLIIDALLDALHDDQVLQLMSVLTAEETPWTLVVFSGRQQILDCCDNILNLNEATSGQNNLKSEGGQP